MFQSLNQFNQVIIKQNLGNISDKNPMQGDHNPNPRRFQVYTGLSNGKGFRIATSKYIYMFDKNGGFYDEYNNYYNQDGEPQQAPSDEDQQFQRVILEEEYQEGDDDDYYEKQYGTGIQDDYQEELHQPKHQHTKILEALSHNAANLHDYPLKTPLRVDFSNMNFKPTKQEILKYYRSKVGKGILNVVLTKQNGKFIGQGYFVCEEISTAQKLIKYQGEQFLGRKVYFQVQHVDQFLADPVSQSQMNIAINQNDFQPLVKNIPQISSPQQQSKKKKYTNKNQNLEQKNQQKKELPVVKHQQKKQPEQKKEEIKVPLWAKYQGEVTMFPKKSSFKQWMNKLGYQEDKDFKNPQKVQQKDPNKKFATVELRIDVHQNIQGRPYENQKVYFEKVN